jgi:glycosyltransferase involved in cell wall biosynthesis
LISVIIPVHNASLFLQRAVQSALEQHEVGEILLIEDGSSDDSLIICQQLARENEKVLCFQHTDKSNHGAGATRNLGLEKARCKYIAFLDADDYYLPNRFIRDTEVFKKHPDAEGIYSATGIFFYTDNKAIHSQFQSRTFTSLKKEIPPEELFFKMTPLGSAGHFHLNALTVKKSVLQKTGGFNKHLKLSQDTHFCIKLAAVCQLYPGQIREPVAIRGVHEANRSTDPNKFLEYHLIMYKDLIKWGKRNKLDKDKMGLLWWKYYGLFNQKHRNVSKSIRNILKLLFIFKTFIKYPILLGTREIKTVLFNLK